MISGKILCSATGNFNEKTRKCGKFHDSKSLNNPSKINTAQKMVRDEKEHKAKKITGQRKFLERKH